MPYRPGERVKVGDQIGTIETCASTVDTGLYAVSFEGQPAWGWFEGRELTSVASLQALEEISYYEAIT